VGRCLVHGGRDIWLAAKYKRRIENRTKLPTDSPNEPKNTGKFEETSESYGAMAVVIVKFV
jgi:hypothetical protein